MRRFCLFLGWLLLVSALVSCSPARVTKNFFAYAEKPFSVTVRGTFTRTAADGYTGAPGLTGTPLTGAPQEIAATVTFGAPSAAGLRETTVAFSAPAAMAGITVTLIPPRESGEAVITLTRPSDYGEIRLQGEHLRPLLRFAEALIPDGDVVTVSAVENGAQSVTVARPDGQKTAVFVFDGGSGRSLPSRVTVKTEGEELRLDIS